MTVAIAAYTANGSGSAEDPDVSVSKPSGTVDGDLLLGHFGLQHGGGAVITPPLTDLWDEISANWEGEACGDIAGASEPSSYTWSVDSDSRLVAVMMRITGADGTSPIHKVGTANSGGSGTATCPSVTTTVDGCLILRMITKRWISYGVTLPGGLTEAYSEGSSSNSYAPHVYAAYEIQSSAGATGTQDFTLSASTLWVANTIAIAPASGGGGGSPTVGRGLTTSQKLSRISLAG